MRFHVYYHVYAVLGWERIVTEFIEALQASLLLEVIEEVRIGVVGESADVLDVLKTFIEHDVPVRLVATALDGWEQVTLNALYKDLDNMDGDWGIFYGHTKGVANPSALNDAWRRSMTTLLITEWQECSRLLARCEAVGCHWLTPEVHPDSVTSPYFGGNFWWAKPALLRRAGPPSMESRYHAEMWMGTGKPAMIADRSPGWPGFGTFRG